MMKRISIYTLLLTLLVLLIGCDNGSVSDPVVEKSSSLVKVCLTVGDSSGVQKSAAVNGSYWTSLTYQYNAVPQWIDPQGTPIHGAAGWTPIDYSAGMSLGYFAPGQWVFGIQIKDGSTIVYEGFSSVINVKNSSVEVDVLVNKLVTDAVAGSVRISVTAPASEDDTLRISYKGTSSGGPYSVIATSDSDKYPFEKTVSDLTAGTYTFTLTHSAGNIEGSIDVTLASGEMAVISGHMDNGLWQLEYTAVKVYSVNTAPATHGSVQVNTTSAAVGDRVSFYANPVSGSRLLSVSVTCGGNPVAYTYNGKMYSFTMPDGNVTVSAIFEVVDTSINLSHFKTILKSFYDSNPGVTAFGRSEDEPAGVEYLGIKDVKIWYDSTHTKICWYSGAGNEITFNNADTSMADLFKDCDKYVDISMKGINTSNITDMHGMFENCVNLVTVDLYGVNTRNVTNMANMFYKAGYNYVPRNNVENADPSKMLDNIENLVISNMNFDTTNVTNMSQMFCMTAITDLSGTNINDWVTGNVTTFNKMFAGYSINDGGWKYWYSKIDSSTFDISGWDTHSCTNFASMFDYCNRLTSFSMSKVVNDVVVSEWDFSAATDINRMFDRCESITSITFPIHTVLANVTDMCFILANADKLTVSDFEDIIARWDITGCPVQFIDYNNSNETTNRIYKGNSEVLTVNTNARRTFCTYGHATPNVYFGGKGNGVDANNAQRLVIIP